MAPTEKVPEQQQSISTSDVYKTFDGMTSDIQAGASYDMKAANAVLSDMAAGRLTPSEADKKLDGIMAAGKSVRIDTAVNSANNIVRSKESQEVYAIYDEMMRDVQAGSVYDMKAAGKILSDMGSGKMTPQEAKQALAAL